MSHDESIVNETGRECDPKIVLAQMGRGVRMNLGVREVVSTGDGLMARVGIRGGHKLIVKLNALDTYDLEIGHKTRNWDWVVDVVRREVYAEDLPEALIALAEGVLR